MNGKQFMVELTNKIGQSDLIGRKTAEKVVGAIKKLKSDLSVCKEKLITAENKCMKTQVTADESAKTAAKATETAAKAAETIRRIEDDARIKGIQLNESLDKLGLSDTKQVELERRIKELERVNAQIQDQLRSELDKVKARENAILKEKEANKIAMGEVFKAALDAIDNALTTINVDELLKQTGQGGGFQSSSSGVTDFKKYRTSSRSYNIKELRKKKKESRKKEKERKKGSRKKERRSKKRRKD